MRMIYTKEDLGCYFNAAFGFEYNARRMIDFAYEHGWDATDLNAEEMKDLDSLVWFTDDTIHFGHGKKVISDYGNMTKKVN